MRVVYLLALVAALFAGASALAVQPEEVLKDPKLEARARALSKDLRCVVCRNQSIDDSDAVIAGDMRKLVRERLLAGDSDADIKKLMVQYYGDYVLLTPRFSGTLILIWLAPLLLLAGGAWIVWRKLRRAAPAGGAPDGGGGDALSPEERARLDKVLKGD